MTKTHLLFFRWLPGLVLLASLLAGCGNGGEPTIAPPPAEPTRAALTYYGGMILVDHRGPKAQIHLASRDEPLWFPQVRNAVAFTMSPEEPDDIAAIYVTDIAAADGWGKPQKWIPAQEAVYVIDSECRGGMGALEAVPFSDREAAQAFIELHGGELVPSWDAIPEDYILERSIAVINAPATMQGMAGAGGCRRLAPGEG